jgi:hypothetical protein
VIEISINQARFLNPVFMVKIHTDWRREYAWDRDRNWDSDRVRYGDGGRDRSRHRDADRYRYRDTDRRRNGDADTDRQRRSSPLSRVVP